jgi:hypothetical protein
LLFEVSLSGVLAWVLVGFELSAIERLPIHPVFHSEMSAMPKRTLCLMRERPQRGFTERSKRPLGGPS